MSATNVAYRQFQRQAESSQPRPFLVDADARLFKGRTKLSPGAQSVYMTLRSLANGKTGELAIRGHALDWRYICRQAQIGRCTWLKRRRELLSAGLLWEPRDRETFFDHKNGRNRTVLGETHYYIRRQAESAKTIKKPRILLKSTSSTVEEVDPQVFQKHPEQNTVAPKVGPVVEPVLPGITESQSSSPATADDDDSLTRLRTKAEELLIPEYNENLVELGLDRIEERCAEKNITVGSHNYFVKSFQNLLSNEREYKEVYDDFAHRIRLREKFMPGFSFTEYDKSPDQDKTKFLTWLRGDSAILLSEQDVKRWKESAVPPSEVLEAYARGEIDYEQAGLHNWYSCDTIDCAQCKARSDAIDQFETDDEHIEF